MIREDVVETTFPVRYAESDQMGFVHHSNYIVWMEEGRSQYMRQKGLGYEHVEKAGAFLAVTEVNVRYIAAACYGDLVTVRTWIEDLRSRTVTFGYEIVRADSRAALATGTVKLVWIDRAGRVIRTPRPLSTLLQG